MTLACLDISSKKRCLYRLFIYHFKAHTISNKLVSKVFAQKKGEKSYDSYKYVLQFRWFQVRSFQSWFNSWTIAALSKGIFSASRRVVELIVLSKSPRLPQEVFSHRFPDPVTKHNSETYQDFHDVWGTATTERDRPSFVANKSVDVSQPLF